jgi:hypothetical protein
VASIFDKGPRGSRLLTPSAFRERYQGALERKAPEAEVTVVSDDELVVTRGQKFNIYLGNAYRDYLTVPTRLDEIIQRHIEAFHTAMATADDATSPDQLVLVIRPNIETTAPAARGDAAGESIAPDDLPIRRLFAGALYVYLAERRGDTFRFPPAETIRKIIPDPEQAMARALENTKALQGDIQLRGAEGDLAMLVCDESLGGSLPLVDELWALPQMQAFGNPVIGLMRNVTIVANGANPEAINLVREFLDAHAGDVNFLSDALFVRKAGGWAVLGN